MSAVELRLSDLPREMAEMRVWLDQHRFETSGFSCRDAEDGVLVSLEFKNAGHAHAFAERFGGRANGPTLSSAAYPPALDAGVSASGIVG